MHAPPRNIWKVAPSRTAFGDFSNSQIKTRFVLKMWYSGSLRNSSTYDIHLINNEHVFECLNLDLALHPSFEWQHKYLIACTHKNSHGYTRQSGGSGRYLRLGGHWWWCMHKHAHTRGSGACSKKKKFRLGALRWHFWGHISTQNLYLDSMPLKYQANVFLECHSPSCYATVSHW